MLMGLWWLGRAPTPLCPGHANQATALHRDPARPCLHQVQPRSVLVASKKDGDDGGASAQVSRWVAAVVVGCPGRGGGGWWAGGHVGEGQVMGMAQNEGGWGRPAHHCTFLLLVQADQHGG